MHAPRPLSAPLLDLALAGFLAIVACQKPTAPSTSAKTAAPAALAVVQGNGQTAQAGRLLAAPVVLRVVDASGRGIPRIPATVIVSTGGGSVDPATAVSDSVGEVRLRWTLGTSASAQALQASVGSVATTVAATALFPAEIVVAQGSQQSGKVATALKSDVVVRVVGAGNTPMVGVAVTFRVTEGGGAITPQSAATNALGEVTAKWTMGATAGSNVLVASVGDLPPATIRATATP